LDNKMSGHPFERQFVDGGNHFTCFKCREGNLSSYCPKCKDETILMPKSFRTPPKNDIKGWVKIELLQMYGVWYNHVDDLGSVKNKLIEEGKLQTKKDINDYNRKKNELLEFHKNNL
jgi:hypothetical protein